MPIMNSLGLCAISPLVHQYLIVNSIVAMISLSIVNMLTSSMKRMGEIHIDFSKSDVKCQTKESALSCLFYLGKFPSIASY